jgi:hypothetical protein
VQIRTLFFFPHFASLLKLLPFYPWKKLLIHVERQHSVVNSTTNQIDMKPAYLVVNLR